VEVKRLFVYGTLKKGFYNHTRCLKGNEGVKLIDDDAKVNGFRLCSVHDSYPAMFPTGDEEDVVSGEIYEISNGRVWESIEMMEVGAGYHILGFRYEEGENLDLTWTYVFSDPGKHPLLRRAGGISSWEKGHNS